jgi:hypothetical protein
MWIDVFDDEGNLVSDPEQRERILLTEEAERIRCFLDDVSRRMNTDSYEIGDFGMVVDWLRNARKANPDLAPQAERFLNRAAAIDADIFRHRKYIEKNGLPIDITDYLS